MLLTVNDDTNPKLKPLVSLGMTFRAAGSQGISDCPFCQKKEHFYIKRKTGLWDCKRCGASGNIEQFLSQYAKSIFEDTEEQDYRPLVKTTGLPAKVFRRWSVGWDGEYFLLHDRVTKEIVNGMTLFDSKGKLDKATWGLPRQLYGMYKAKREQVRTIWVAEGHKDCWTLSWLLWNDSTQYAVGVPGAETFKPEWVWLFKGKHVVLCYDNDEAGQAGTRKAIGLLTSIAKSIKVLDWPATKKEGFDVTDYFKQLKRKGKTRNTILSIIEKRLKPWRQIEWIGEVKETEQPKAVIVQASEIEPVHMKYLWLGRIPLACTTIYYGMPQQGKSSQALDVAARISTGALWPNTKQNKAPKGSTLLIAQEDEVSEVILWRYEAMGGDRKKLHIFKGIKNPGQDYLEWLDITKHLPMIEEAIKKIKDLKLVIIDPISAYFGKSDTYKVSEVRATLGPLNALAQKHGMAILLIHHVNKNVQQDAVHRLSGSTAFADFARQAWLFGNKKEDETRKLMVSAKKSYGPPATGLAFRIKQADPADVNSIKLEYETTDIQETAQELLTPKKKPAGRPPTKFEAATELLLKELQEAPVPTKTIRALAAQNEISDKTLERAQRALSIKRCSYKGVLCWKLKKSSK